MSVSHWNWRPSCDGYVCCGNCDDCGYDEVEEMTNKEKMINAIESLTWYHINCNGKLVEGATSDMNPLYRAEDIFNAIDEVFDDEE